MKQVVLDLDPRLQQPALRILGLQLGSKPPIDVSNSSGVTPRAHGGSFAGPCVHRPTAIHRLEQGTDWRALFDATERGQKLLLQFQVGHNGLVSALHGENAAGVLQLG